MPHDHHPPPPTPNPTYLAITESISLHKYHVQNTILTLLSLPAVPWESLIPPPRVSLEQAEEHVRGVRRGCGVREDGGRGGQEQGEEQRQEQGEDRGKVLDVEEEARTVVERLKREEQETGTAASILVELEEHPYKLILPDLDQLTNDQRTALALHARHTRIIDALRARLRGVEVFVPASVPAPPSPAAVVNHSGPTATPTATYQPPPPPPPPHQRLRTIARLLPRFIGAAIKIEIALWMITRSLHPSSDWRYWAFVLAGVGWWVWECVGVYRAERERGRVVREREREREREVRVPQEGQEAVGRPVPPAAAVDPGNRQQQQQQQQQPAAPRRTRGNNNRNNTRPNPLPFLGLAYERRLLRLFYLPPSSSNSHPTTTTTTTPPTNPHRIPTKDTNLPLAPADPSIAWTYLFIPMYVCVLSLWPAGEAARKRAIREREGDMRALSARLGEGVAVAEAEAGAEAEVQRRASEQQREGAGQGASEDGTRSLPHDPTQQPPPLPTPTTTTPAATTDAATTTATATAPSVIPRNLSPASERYWRRILARGETIDWDEERAAQERVLGAAGRGAGGGGAGQDEDAEAGGLGMGMGLW